jgi:hypothetical protein
LTTWQTQPGEKPVLRAIAAAVCPRLTNHTICHHVRSTAPLAVR